MYFALACEGVTDFAVIESVLCGFFDEDITDEITHLQPHLDKTSKKQKGFSNWELLLDYLRSPRFNDYIVIQMDTDISEHPNFDISHSDENNIELDTPSLIKNVIDKITEIINSCEHDIHEELKERILFCICVHSIECWLLAYYKNMRKPKTKNCFRALAHELKKDENSLKNYATYQEISDPLSEKKNLEKIRLKESSLHLFLECLSIIPSPIDQR